MKITSKNIMTALGAAMLTLNEASAHVTITPGDSVDGGITYNYRVDIEDHGGDDFVKATVGAWSWEDQGIFEPGEDPVGWTHTSDWYALNLEGPLVLTLTLQRDSTVGNPTGGFHPTDHFFPSFTLYSGVDDDLMPANIATALGYEPATAHDHHTYNNDGNINWAEDLTYLDHFNNTTLTSITRTWTLNTGLYSLVVGSNSPSTNSPPLQGYRIIIDAVPVPEPSLALLSSLGLISLLRRRRNA